MSKKNDRFIKVHSENMGSEVIFVDKQTGVNYLFISTGYSGGLTPLLKADGTPIVTAIPKEYDE